MTDSVPPRRVRHYSGGPWELSVGYCRGTRIGDLVGISGSTAVKNGEVVGLGDAAVQARQTLLTIDEALQALGATMQDVYRYRVFLTRPEDGEAVTGVLAEFFGTVHPCATVVVISALLNPDLLLEIEVDAIAESASPVVP
ncbi:MAG: Rid family hydrolase [Thermomicrobiales bacterium]